MLHSGENEQPNGGRVAPINYFLRHQRLHPCCLATALKLSCCWNSLFLMRRRAKYKLQTVVRTNLASDQKAFECVYEMEDEAGIRGVRWVGRWWVCAWHIWNLAGSVRVLCLFSFYPHVSHRSHMNQLPSPLPLTKEPGDSLEPYVSSGSHPQS